MKKMMIILALITNAALVQAAESRDQAIFPQTRLPNETFQQSLAKFKQQASPLSVRQAIDDMPIDVATPIVNVDYSKVPVVDTEAELTHIFDQIRDTRFLIEPGISDFMRRISWLYPTNYCYARTAVAGMFADEKNLVRPSTIFAFGNLEAQSHFTASGKVYWNWHVSQILGAKTSDGTTNYYVLDPSIDSGKPLGVYQWYQKMTDANLTVAVCGKYTYSSMDSCSRGEPYSAERIMGDINQSLNEERLGVVELGYTDWTNILGDNPPWRLSVFYK